MKITIACLSLLTAAWAVDRSHWPRLSPVVFVHGVNSSGKMWAFDLQEDPMGVKTGSYNLYRVRLF